MALTQINLKTKIVVSDDCKHLIVTDETGLYNSVSNPLGYGVPNGVAVNDVTMMFITITYVNLGITAVFSFLITNGVIGAMAVDFAGQGAINVPTLASYLPSLTFPPTSSNPFITVGPYISSFPVTTITLPVLTDGQYNVAYRIRGSASDNGTPTIFDYTVNDTCIRDCESSSCIDKSFYDMDIDCGCSDKKLKETMRSKAYLDIAKYAEEKEDYALYNQLLQKSKSICACNCGC